MAIRKPKMKKYRKAPKKSASLAVWERYRSHMTEVDKHNREKIAAYHKKVGAVKKKENIVKALSGIGRVSRVKLK